MDQFAAKFARGFDQVKQFASEKIGTAEVLTQFPPEYVELEKRVDTVKRIYESIIRVTRQFVDSNHYEPPLGESVLQTFDRVGDRIVSFTGQVAGQPHRYGTNDAQIRTLQQVTAELAVESAAQLPASEPMSEALRKYGLAQEKLAHARADLDVQIQTKFLEPFSNTLETTIQFAVKARKAAQRARLDLDAVKHKMQSAKSHQLGPLQRDLTAAEEQFAVHVEDAMISMKAVCDSPEALKNLSDLIEAQTQYYKAAYEAFNTIVI